MNLEITNNKLNSFIVARRLMKERHKLIMVRHKLPEDLQNEIQNIIDSIGDIEGDMLKIDY